MHSTRVLNVRKFGLHHQHLISTGHMLKIPQICCIQSHLSSTHSVHLLHSEANQQAHCLPSLSVPYKTKQLSTVCISKPGSYRSPPWKGSTFSSNVSAKNKHFIPCFWLQRRGFSLSSILSEGGSTQASQAAHSIVSSTSSASTSDIATSPFSGVVETSAQAKWASDASDCVTDLSVQNDISSLGLGGYTPIGLIQWSLEWIHLHTGLPWWSSIIVATVILRTAMFPLAVRVQANAARFNNIRPETEKLMAKIKHHNRFGRKNLSAVANKKLMDLYSEHSCSPLQLMVTPFIQVPIFISFFIGLRRMANVPVESMKTGGAFWFTDLTAPDAYYILPFLSCASLLATIEMGGEAGVTNPQLEKMKTVFRAFSILLIPLTAQFPSGLFMYWLTSSLFSISQILLLKFPNIRSKLGIPELITTPEHEKSSQNAKGFVQMIKENYNTAVVDDEAKREKAAAKKRYQKLLKDKSPKLYDHPPHLRKIKQ